MVLRVFGPVYTPPVYTPPVYTAVYTRIYVSPQPGTCISDSEVPCHPVNSQRNVPETEARESSSRTSRHAAGVREHHSDGRRRHLPTAPTLEDVHTPSSPPPPSMTVSPATYMAVLSTSPCGPSMADARPSPLDGDHGFCRITPSAAFYCFSRISGSSTRAQRPFLS